MIKREMIDLLVNEYGYDRDELKNDKGNDLTNSELEKLIAKEEKKAEEDKPEEKVEDTPEEEEDIFGDLDSIAFEPRHSFKDDDLILCMSGVNGDLYFRSPISNFHARTRDFGQTMKIPYGDLKYVNNIAPQAFEDGQVVILNQDIREEFGLGDIHKRVITPKNVRKVLELEADDLGQFIAEMPKSMRSALYNEARKLYKEGKIDSIRTVQVIEDTFGVSLDTNAPIHETVG